MKYENNACNVTQNIKYDMKCENNKWNAMLQAHVLTEKKVDIQFLRVC